MRRASVATSCRRARAGALAAAVQVRSARRRSVFVIRKSLPGLRVAGDRCSRRRGAGRPRPGRRPVPMVRPVVAELAGGVADRVVLRVREARLDLRDEVTGVRLGGRRPGPSSAGRGTSGRAIAARMPTIRMTTRSSMRVKPFSSWARVRSLLSMWTVPLLGWLWVGFRQSPRSWHAPFVGHVRLGLEAKWPRMTGHTSSRAKRPEGA